MLVYGVFCNRKLAGNYAKLKLKNTFVTFQKMLLRNSQFSKLNFRSIPEYTNDKDRFSYLKFSTTFMRDCSCNTPLIYTMKKREIRCIYSENIVLLYYWLPIASWIQNLNEWTLIKLAVHMQLNAPAYSTFVIIFFSKMLTTTASRCYYLLNIRFLEIHRHKDLLEATQASLF